MINVPTKTTIVERIINNIIAQPNSKITYFGPGAARSILSAISTEIQSLYLAVAEVDRAWDVQTASGEDLDRLGAQRGLFRFGARPSSLVARIILRNTVGGAPATPTMTTLTASTNSGAVFNFTGTATFVRFNSTSDYSFVNVVMESADTGPGSNVSLGTLTSVISQSFTKPANHDLIITNITPGQGGAEEESDEEFRQRIIDKPNIDALGVEPFYLSIIRELEPSVIRIKLTGGTGIGAIVVNYLTDSGAPLSDLVRDDIINTIKELFPVGTSNVSLVPMTLLPIDLNVRTTLMTGYTLAQVSQNIAESLADYLNWSEWALDGESSRVVPRDELITLVNTTDGVDLLDTVSFTPTGDTTLGDLVLPRAGNVIVTDSRTNISYTAGNIASTYPTP